MAILFNIDLHNNWPKISFRASILENKHRFQLQPFEHQIMIIKIRPETFHFVVGLRPAIDYNPKVAPSIDPLLIRCQIKCGIKTSTKLTARHLRVKRTENSFVRHKLFSAEC